MICKILLAGAAAIALSSAAVAQTAPGDAAGPTTPAQTTPTESSSAPADRESRPDAQGPATPQQSSAAGAPSTPPVTSDDPNSATGMRGDTGYGPGWDAGKCASAKKNGTKTNGGDCPPTSRPR